jgi:hypothetical protein
MRIPRQIYFCGVSGALAGLLAWLLIGWTSAARWQNLWLSSAFVGAGTGGLIAVALAFTRGCVEQWGYRRLWSAALASLGFGSAAGAAGLLIGQAAFLWIGGELLGRGLGWIVLSLLIGLGQSAGDASIRRCLVGSIGGFVSGLFSGIVYEGLTQVFLSHSGTAQVWASSIGLMAVGALLASGIPLAETLAARGVLVVLSGQRNGAEYPILDRLLIGASESCRVLIPDDPDVEPEQLTLQASSGGIRIANVGRSRTVLVNGGNLAPGDAASCPSGTMIRAGKTELRVL